MSHSPSRADLLSQQDYAKAVTQRIDGSVTASWISKSTKKGKTVADRFRPDLDAVFDGDQLIGYREPQDRTAGNPDGGPTFGNEVDGRGQGSSGGQDPNGASGTRSVRRNPGIGNAHGRGRHSQGTGGLSGLDKMAGQVGEAVNKSPAFRRGAIRFGGAAGGFLLVSLFSGKPVSLGAAAIGALFGFGIAEYSIQAEPAPTPTNILPPGMENGQR